MREQRFLKRRPALAKAGALAVMYVAGAKLGLALAFEHQHVTAVWPPTGIAVAMLLLFGLRLWPGVFAGAVLANVLDGVPLAVAAGIAVGNTLAPVVAVALVRRLGVKTSLSRLRDVVFFVLAGAFAAMTISATLGTAVLSLAGATFTGAMWRVWWVGDAMGVVLLAPIVLTLFAEGTDDNLFVRRWRRAVPVLLAEAAITFLAVQTDSPAGYLVIPIALFAAIELEQTGAAAAVLVMSGIDIWHATVAPQAGLSIEQQIMTLQGINATIAVILLAFAAAMQERRRAHEELRASADQLEERVRERTSQLRASEDGFEQAQRLAQIGSFSWDAAADRNEWSDELYRIYGLQPGADDPPAFDEYLSFVREDERDRVRRSIAEAIGRGGVLEHDYPVVLPDGRAKWVHAYVEVILGPEGSLAGLRGTCQDITARRQAEEARRASEARYKALVDAAPDAVVVVDERGHIVLTNIQTQKLLGYEPDALLGLSVEVLLPEGLKDIHRIHRRGFMSSPTTRPMGAGLELEARHRDGSLVPVDISLSAVTTVEGTLVTAALRDATERRRGEDALRSALDREHKAADDLRKLDQAKDAFLSAVSHELRTPLTAILGFAELLQEPDVRSSVEMTDGLVERLQFSAHRLADLLADLLDIDRLHRGILEPHRRDTLLRDLVERALGSLDTGTHPLRVDVADRVVAVDPAQTERIVENLVTNAVKYTPSGTEIVVRASATDDLGVVIQVDDRGPGIPFELRESIFEPFFRGEVGTFTPGTGIGLALVNRFAQLHGGHAWVEDREGGGASFHVTLPGPPDHRHAAVA